MWDPLIARTYVSLRCLFSLSKRVRKREKKKVAEKILPAKDSPLDTLVHPRRAVLLLVNVDRERLTATVVLSFDDGNVESVGVHR